MLIGAGLGGTSGLVGTAAFLGVKAYKSSVLASTGAKAVGYSASAAGSCTLVVAGTVAIVAVTAMKIIESEKQVNEYCGKLDSCNKELDRIWNDENYHE